MSLIAQLYEIRAIFPNNAPVLNGISFIETWRLATRTWPMAVAARRAWPKTRSLRPVA